MLVTTLLLLFLVVLFLFRTTPYAITIVAANPTDNNVMDKSTMEKKYSLLRS